ncbi:curli-like amyloid fiber formation chaperone CsgH [Hymenobacter lapidiphilus]|uniref:Curli assembly protein CsgC n=1 Tax=Hymenobacter lapidiphilus TaxID=2608003 RepID=A0A7Y7U4E2_9BACT|nr:curli-like amyloid fiber formation chaperone CsgH [Hymenobacter lapidiphilus]NVO30313.1 hypothetical protein [Hymenobacter lapidiphilus]
MYTALFFLAGWAALLGVSQAASDLPCRAWLEATPHGNMLEMTGKCASLTKKAASFRYEITLERQAAGGRSSSQQGGEFELAPGQSVVLSSTRVNIDGQSTYIGHLRVFDTHNVLLAQDSVRHEPGSK